VLVASRLSPGPKQKETVPLSAAAAEMPGRLDAFQAALYERATTFRDERTVRAGNWGELVEAVQSGFATALWCGRDECDDRLKEATTATPRCIPFGTEAEEGPCVSCGRPSAWGTRLVFGRSY
jgi:prolyl-tRNA synthetase